MPEHSQGLGCLPKILIGFLLLVGACAARWPAQPSALQRTVVDAAGKPHTFRIWTGERVLKGPFFSDPSEYVEWDGTRREIHAGSFGNGIGRVRLAPDRKHAIVESRFEGGVSSGLEVELESGQYGWVSRGDGQWSASATWPVFPWRTALELESKEELRSRLTSGDPARVGPVLEELEARSHNGSRQTTAPPCMWAHPAFPDEGIRGPDWEALVAAYMDTRLPLRTRQDVGWRFFSPSFRIHHEVPLRADPMPDPELRKLATALDEKDQDRQLLVAWWLCETAPFPSLKFDYFDALDPKKQVDATHVAPVRKAWAARLASRAR